MQSLAFHVKDLELFAAIDEFHLFFTSRKVHLAVGKIRQFVAKTRKAISFRSKSPMLCFALLKALGILYQR